MSVFFGSVSTYMYSDIQGSRNGPDSRRSQPNGMSTTTRSVATSRPSQPTESVRGVDMRFALGPNSWPEEERDWKTTGRRWTIWVKERLDLSLIYSFVASPQFTYFYTTYMFQHIERPRDAKGMLLVSSFLNRSV